MSFKEMAKNFNPAWFAAVMGTAVIPLVLSFLDNHLSYGLALFFFGLAALMAIAILVPWVAKYSSWQNMSVDLDHPIIAHFLPTFPIALVILAMDLLRFPSVLPSGETAGFLALLFWLAGTVGIYWFNFLIMIRVFGHKGITPGHANFGWFIPPVSQLIVPAAGLELAQWHPSLWEPIFGVSLVSLGVGFFLFLFVGAVVFQRYVYQELPMNRLAPTIFIAMAPTAIIALIIFKMLNLFARQPVFGLSPALFAPLAKMAIVVTWGFSAWWLVMACLVIIHYLRRLELPYALTWWAFTFPTGAFCLATGAAWRATQFSSLYFIFIAATAFLLAVWIVVFVNTARAIASGKIFLPAP